MSTPISELSADVANRLDRITIYRDNFSNKEWADFLRHASTVLDEDEMHADCFDADYVEREVEERIEDAVAERTAELQKEIDALQDEMADLRQAKDKPPAVNCTPAQARAMFRTVL